MAGPVRLSVVGGRRGGAFRRALAAMPEQVALTAVCDRREAVLAGCREAYPHVPTFAGLEARLAADSCDAVLVATPIQVHAAQSMAALRVGKHVLCEVVERAGQPVAIPDFRRSAA